MLRKVINKKYVFLLVLSALCFSSATLGGFLLHGHEIHIEDNHTHFHHIHDHKHLGDESHNEDHGLGDTENHDTENILYHDFLLTNLSRSTKPYSDIREYLHFSFSETFSPTFFIATSRITNPSNSNKSPTTNLYQLHSSFLI